MNWSMRVVGLWNTRRVCLLLRRGGRSGDRGRPRRRLDRLPRRNTLVRRETWFRGWSAEIDRRPTAIQGADGLFMMLVPTARSASSFGVRS